MQGLWQATAGAKHCTLIVTSQGSEWGRVGTFESVYCTLKGNLQYLGLMIAMLMKYLIVVGVFADNNALGFVLSF